MRRILVVDDYVDSADSLAAILSLHGYEARAVYCCRDALSIARSWSPWAACLDLVFDVSDGHALAHDLRRICNPVPHFLAVTGFQSEEMRRRSMAMGFCEHFLKPCEAVTLVSALQRCEQSAAA